MKSLVRKFSRGKFFSPKPSKTSSLENLQDGISLKMSYSLDFEVEIDGKRFLHSQIVLTQHSPAIADFIQENPGKRFKLEIEDVDQLYIQNYLDSLYGFRAFPKPLSKSLPLLPNLSSWNTDPLATLLIADYLRVRTEDLRPLEKQARDYIKRRIDDFASCYCLPFTEIPEEINYILKLTKYTRIRLAFYEAVVNIDCHTRIEVAAAIIHCLKGVVEVDLSWIGFRLTLFDFPPSFCFQVGLPYFNDYILEEHNLQILPYDPFSTKLAPIYEAPRNFRLSFRIVQKRQRNTLGFIVKSSRLDDLDRAFLRQLGGKFQLTFKLD